MNLKQIIISLCGTFIMMNVLFGQNDPVFENFEGTVYKIPAKQVGKRYGEHVKNYEVAGEVRLPELNIPQRQDTIRIPGVELTKGFGIIFRSTMKIPVTGKYGFTLDSDDGSVFWIKDSLIVDNDGSHKMTKKGAAVVLEKGEYPVTVWYQQAYPFLYGIIFSSKFLSLEDEAEFSPEGGMILTENELFFESGKHRLDSTGKRYLTELAEKLKTMNFQKIIITGHTDHIGDELRNIKLSENRANTVAAFLNEKLGKDDVDYEISGNGERSPIGDNETEEGRRKNRRVVLVLE